MTTTMTYNGNAFDYIKTDKNEEGQYECATCEQPFGNQGEVCWADVGEFNYADGKPLCGYCCDEMRRLDDDEESIPDAKECGHYFDCGCGMTVCGECDEDMCDNEACAIYYTYRNDACMCDGCDFCDWKIRICESGLKMTPPFIPEKKDDDEEKDELCSAIDASGNALF
jgi:hypothetical protein